MSIDDLYPGTLDGPNRFSPFGELVSDGKALRELESDAFAERWLYRREGWNSAMTEEQAATINAFFVAIEMEFIAVRNEVATDPDRFPFPVSFYDERLLQIRRDSGALDFIAQARPETHDYVQTRSKMPCPLPPLPQPRAAA